jgi:O-succinylbenzoic acid--CoA ligase
MDPTLLEHPAFWLDSTPLVVGGVVGNLEAIPELAGHVLFQTSGSTGSPKWVAVSKQALLISAAAVNAHLRVTSESVWGLALPIHHVGGFGVAARAFGAACKLEVFPQRWDPALCCRWLSQKSVTHTSLVPTQVHDLVKIGLHAPPALQAVVVGGGALETPVGLAARELGWPVLASFGMTEASSQIATQGLDLLESPYQSAPIPLLPIWKARVSENHLLEISGPALFSGYLTDGKFAPREREWHATSDRAALVNDHLTPLGRNDLWVKVLGELVDPEAIERELIEISGGEIKSDQVAVIAVPNERSGHLLVPVFEEPIAHDLIKKTLLAYQQMTPGFRRLQPASIRAEFPRSPLGKLLRSRLAENLSAASPAGPASFITGSNC